MIEEEMKSGMSALAWGDKHHADVGRIEQFYPTD
jgi:hypothetical protein